MKFHALSAIAATASFAVFLLFESALGAAEPLSTDRLVHGVITSVDANSGGLVTIASSQRSVTGKIDPARTKITLHGKPAKLSDLKVTSHAKAELCLDETWVSIDEH